LHAPVVAQWPESWDPGAGKSTSAATADSPRAEVRQKQR